MSGDVLLREMRWWDIAPVLHLEREVFAEDAWTEGMFWSELADTRYSKASRYYVVADHNHRIVGYGGFWAVSGEGAVQTIAVAPGYQGVGLGAALLTDLLRQAIAFECREVFLEVRVDNPRAQRLYERFGFEPVGVRRGYYQPGDVDALVMRLTEVPIGRSWEARPVSSPSPGRSTEGSPAPASASPANSLPANPLPADRSPRDSVSTRTERSDRAPQ